MSSRYSCVDSAVNCCLQYRLPPHQGFYSVLSVPKLQAAKGHEVLEEKALVRYNLRSVNNRGPLKTPFRRSAGSTSQLLLIKTLKYTEYSCGFEHKIRNKISRHPLETEFLEVPNNLSFQHAIRDWSVCLLLSFVVINKNIH